MDPLRWLESQINHEIPNLFQVFYYPYLPLSIMNESMLKGVVAFHDYNPTYQSCYYSIARNKSRPLTRDLIIDYHDQIFNHIRILYANVRGSRQSQRHVMQRLGYKQICLPEGVSEDEDDYLLYITKKQWQATKTKLRRST